MEISSLLKVKFLLRSSSIFVAVLAIMCLISRQVKSELTSKRMATSAATVGPADEVPFI